MRPLLRTFLRVGLVLGAMVAVPLVLEAQDSVKAKPARRARGDRNKLTPTEIGQAGGVVTTLDAIRLLRPWWLAPPPGRMVSTDMGGDTRAASAVIVYIDGMRQPDIESSLITVPAKNIVEIRYLDQNRAIQLFGPGHEAGVIDVSTTDKKKP